MKRKQFFTVAAVIPMLYGLAMAFAPTQVMGPMIPGMSPTVELFVRILGSNLIAIGIMNFMARNDAGSSALRAVMMANIVVHLLGLVLDVWGVNQGILAMAALPMAIIVHVGFAVGFTYHLRRTKSIQTVSSVMMKQA